MAAFANLSGTTKLPSGAGLAGVSVSLVKTKTTSVVSGSTGTWTLQVSAGVGSRESEKTSLPSNLTIENGHLVLRLNGVSADGRRFGATAEIPPPMIAGRTLAAAVDTLLFSLGGTIRARLPVGTLDTTGIVTILDTAAIPVDQGTTATTWASGCTATKVACTDGTWKAGGPDPDHSAFKLIKESDHFTIYSDEAISDATATSALNTLETTVWQNLFNANLFMPEPWCKSATKIKPAIHVHSDWGLTGGGWDATHIGMWIGTGGLSDHWGLTHEFTHSWQTSMGSSGGMSCNQSNTCGWIFESHANFTPHQLPEYQSNAHCSEMLANAPHVYLGSTRDRYCNWQFMEFLKDKYCPSAVNDIWATSGADPFTNLQKSRNWTIEQLNDFFGDWAMHNVVWDYKATPETFRTSYGNITSTSAPERMRRLMPLESLDDAWATNRRFVSPYYGAPQRFGYNVVRLYPEANATTVTVKFRGVIQTGANTDYRYGLVATNAAFTSARYSAMKSGTDGSITFKVASGEPLFLVVTATPSKFQTITWDQEYNSICRYPYMIELANAWPAGFQNGTLDACPTGTVRHANGGGCAPASTPSTVFVGPYARILSGASASGTARIEDEAIVYSGSVTGGTVGALSVLQGFNVSGTATVRTTFYPLGFYEGTQSASGTANLYGDVELRGTGTNIASGLHSGMVEATTAAVPSVADVTAKGPYTWRP